jgi:phosphoglycolate phosphatase-like HAD superfamily hydrolase
MRTVQFFWRQEHLPHFWDRVAAGMGKPFPAVAETLAHLFDGRYCAGQYQGLTKADIVKLIKEHHGITSGFMIGDRFHDVEAGLANGLTAVGCLFGTGTREELKRAHHLINGFGELQRIVT